MNYRDYKMFAPNSYYHVFNRGVGKQNIFNDEQDFKGFLFRLNDGLFPPLHGHHRDGDHGGEKGANHRHSPYIRKALPSQSFSLICYCLMPNHFHLVIRQLGLVKIGKLISKVSNSYCKYFNKKYDRVGSLFQDTFKAVLIDDDSYLLWLSAYIHQNPKVAGIVKDLKFYPWSSYLDYAGLRQGNMCDKSFILSKFKNPVAYIKFVEDSLDKIQTAKELHNLFID